MKSLMSEVMSSDDPHHLFKHTYIMDGWMDVTCMSHACHMHVTCTYYSRLLHDWKVSQAHGTEKVEDLWQRCLPGDGVRTWVHEN